MTPPPCRESLLLSVHHVLCAPCVVWHSSIASGQAVHLCWPWQGPAVTKQNNLGPGHTVADTATKQKRQARSSNKQHQTTRTAVGQWGTLYAVLCRTYQGTYQVQPTCLHTWLRGLDPGKQPPTMHIPPTHATPQGLMQSNMPLLTRTLLPCDGSFIDSTPNQVHCRDIHIPHNIGHCIHKAPRTVMTTTPKQAHTKRAHAPNNGVTRLTFVPRR